MQTETFNCTEEQLMPTRRIRVFFPTKRYVGHTTLERSVDYWTWTRTRGLWTVLQDGRTWKSDYTLRELLGSKQPEGPIRESVLLPHWLGCTTGAEHYVSERDRMQAARHTLSR